MIYHHLRWYQTLQIFQSNLILSNDTADINISVHSSEILVIALVYCQWNLINGFQLLSMCLLWHPKSGQWWQLFDNILITFLFVYSFSSESWYFEFVKNILKHVKEKIMASKALLLYGLLCVFVCNWHSDNSAEEKLE